MGAARIRARVLAGGLGDRAHIPQKRGGAHFQLWLRAGGDGKGEDSGRGTREDGRKTTVMQLMVD